MRASVPDKHSAPCRRRVRRNAEAQDVMFNVSIAAGTFRESLDRAAALRLYGARAASIIVRMPGEDLA